MKPSLILAIRAATFTVRLGAALQSDRTPVLVPQPSVQQQACTELAEGGSRTALSWA